MTTEATITKITRAYERHYRDNEQTTFYVEWIDSDGISGRTEGQRNNGHMKALAARALREGVRVESEIW